MKDKIEKQYYTFKELIWFFEISWPGLADICKMYQIPYKKESKKLTHVSVNDLWKIYKIMELRRQGYGHKIIPAFLNISKDERDRITTYCTIILG